jgi:hypothetical protein
MHEKFRDKNHKRSLGYLHGIIPGMLHILSPFVPKTENTFLEKLLLKKYNYRQLEH